MYVCVYRHVYTLTHLRIHRYVFTYTCIYALPQWHVAEGSDDYWSYTNCKTTLIFTFVYILTSVCTCMYNIWNIYVCICVYMYVYVFSCTYECIYIYVPIHMHVYICIYMYMHISVREWGNQEGGRLKGRPKMEKSHFG